MHPYPTDRGVEIASSCGRTSERYWSRCGQASQYECIALSLRRAQNNGENIVQRFCKDFNGTEFIDNTNCWLTEKRSAVGNASTHRTLSHRRIRKILSPGFVDHATSETRRGVERRYRIGARPESPEDSPLLGHAQHKARDPNPPSWSMCSAIGAAGARGYSAGCVSKNRKVRRCRTSRWRRPELSFSPTTGSDSHKFAIPPCADVHGQRPARIWSIRRR